MSESDQNKVRATFDDWAARGRAEGMERGHGPAAREAFEALNFPREGRYIDIGCGNGYTLRWAAREEAASLALGFDLAPGMVARARELSAGDPSVRVEAGSFPEVAASEPAASFDAVFTMEALYYLPALEPALAKIFALLKPGGRLVCVVDFYRENPDSHSWPEDVGVPMILLSESEWKSAFEAAGFVDVEQRRLKPDQPEGSPEWKESCGSLMTLGKRP